MNYLETANEFFSNDIYATETTGIKIEKVDVGYAKCSMDIDRRHMNAGNVVMGGAIYTLADFTFSVAANCSRPLTVSLSSTINYLYPATGKKLIAEAKCIKDGKTVCFCDVTVSNEEGKTVAVMHGSGFRKSNKP